MAILFGLPILYDRTKPFPSRCGARAPPACTPGATSTHRSHSASSNRGPRANALRQDCLSRKPVLGTSKWNKIEHRLFAFISKNRRGQPLTSLKVIVNLIAGTDRKSVG